MSDPINDYMILGGQYFPLTGPARGMARSEFEAGLKVGKASYDNREDAFYTVFDDLTGGFGERTLNIREQLGTYWFADPVCAPETAYAGRVTLPLRQQYITTNSGPTEFDIEVNVGYPFVEWDTSYVFGIGSAIYTLSSLGATPTRRHDNTKHVIDIIGAADPTNGNSRLYASFADGGTGGTMRISLDGGETWAATSSKYVAHNQLPYLQGVTGDLLSQDTVYSYQTGVEKGFLGGDLALPANYFPKAVFYIQVYPALYPQFKPISTPKTLTTTTVPIESCFFWDHKVLGQWGDRKVSFMVPQTGNGLSLYTIPRGSYVQAVAYTGVSSFESGTQRMFLAGDLADADNYVNVPTFTIVRGFIVSSDLVYISDQHILANVGEEAWNHLVEGDEQIVAALDISREIRWIGVLPASWGEPALFARAGSKGYVLDFFSRKIYPVELGSNKPLICGNLWNGKLLVADGWNVYETNTGNPNTRNIGFPRKWGTPPNLVGADGDPYQIVYLIPLDDELLAVAVDPIGKATMLFKHNGAGWHQVGKRMDNFTAQYGFRATFPLGTDVFDDREQAIIIPGQLDTSGSLTYGYWQFDLPKITHQPTVGLDTFASDPATLYTGWWDGGFFDIDGTLLRMNIDAFFPDADCEVKVYYRLNNDPESELTATWTQMVDIAGSNDVFNADNAALYFSPTNAKAGISYRTVQFKLVLSRGDEDTNSPEMRALTVVYLKTPELRTMWTVNVDVNRMVEMSKMDNNFWIDGDPATVESVWAKLKELWINDHKLVSFQVPNIGDKVYYVKLTELPLTFDDWRFAVTAKGAIALTLLEPVV